MSANNYKFVTWTAFGIFVTIFIVFIYVGSARINKIVDVQYNVLEIIYRLDERTKVLDQIDGEVDNIQANVVNPYKQLENKMTLEVFTENLNKARRNDERVEEATQQTSDDVCQKVSCE